VFDTVKETGDHSSFNSWGRDRYWRPKNAEVNAWVKEGSAALALGFFNFPMDRFGVQRPALKALARTPVLPGQKPVNIKR
jgi:hypothetical protein